MQSIIIHYYYILILNLISSRDEIMLFDVIERCYTDKLFLQCLLMH